MSVAQGIKKAKAEIQSKGVENGRTYANI